MTTYKLTAYGYQWFEDGQRTQFSPERTFAYTDSDMTAKDIAQLYMPDSKLVWRLRDSWWIANAERPLAFPVNVYIEAWVIIPLTLNTPLLWTAWMPGGSMYKREVRS